jgi:DnaJ family protein A protein 5
LHDDLEWAAAEGKDPEEWECVACGKIFRSEAAWDSHERSKKHMKEVERLTREIQEEDEGLDLEGQGQTTMVTMPEEEQDILESKSSSPPTEVETELESDPRIPCTDQEVEVSVDEEEQRSSGRQKKPSKTHKSSFGLTDEN